MRIFLTVICLSVFLISCGTKNKQQSADIKPIVTVVDTTKKVVDTTKKAADTVKPVVVEKKKDSTVKIETKKTK